MKYLEKEKKYAKQRQDFLGKKIKTEPLKIDKFDKDKIDKRFKDLPIDKYDKKIFRK